MKKRNNKKKDLQLPAKPQQTAKELLLWHINEMLKKHVATVEAVLTDYVVDCGAETEISIAHANLTDDLTTLLETEFPDEDFDQAIKILEKLTAKDIGTEKLLKHVDANDVDTEFISKCDEAEIADALKGKGYAVIRLESFADADKLTEFVQREIYPNHNDQKDKMFI